MSVKIATFQAIKFMITRHFSCGQKHTKPSISHKMHILQHTKLILMQFHVIMRAHTNNNLFIYCSMLVFCQHIIIFTFHSLLAACIIYPCMFVSHLHNCSFSLLLYANFYILALFSAPSQALFEFKSTFVIVNTRKWRRGNWSAIEMLDLARRTEERCWRGKNCN